MLLVPDKGEPNPKVLQKELRLTFVLLDHCYRLHLLKNPISFYAIQLYLDDKEIYKTLNPLDRFSFILLFSGASFESVV